ncbi:ethylene receptor 2-like isoform X1 [Coffea arabica]|uniref:Ethylene receptor n=1 Tax=Coffea arabica TaxID=13443 RepID=A0ABM4X203_COFAR
MFRRLASGLLISSLLISLSAADNGFSNCNCDEGGFWSTENILDIQKVSDFLIAVAYFSIPIEILYFVSCSNVPFKLVLLEFVAFIILCGMTHLLNGWTYGPHPFQLMLALTIFKTLTALVSVATAITLISIIPFLLKIKVREILLRRKTWDLGRQVGMIKKQKEAGLHVRMLTQEIRRSLDRHTILDTTLVELSKTLDLENCAIWMPNDNKTEMNLIHESIRRNSSDMNECIPTSDPDVREIKGSDGVKILESDSPLAVASSGGNGEPGAVAAIRMPMLRVSNFKGGTPEMVPACYAILVLVLPGSQGRSWSIQELEIVKVVADQVAVAISHAAVLEESQHMREKLEEQNRALQQAKQDALLASQTRNAFQMVMSSGLRRPMHSILGLLSMMQEENLSSEQQLLVDAMVKTSNVLSTLINDVMDTSTKDNGRFPLETKSFSLHAMIKVAACLAKCLCMYKGFNFAMEVDKSLPNHVMGDERRVFQVIFHMVGSLLNSSNGGGCLVFRVLSASGSQASNQGWGPWRSSSSDGYTYIKFDVGICKDDSDFESMPSTVSPGCQRYNSGIPEEGLSFSVCRKLVQLWWQLMQGDIWVVPNSEGFKHSLALILRFQKQTSTVVSISEQGQSSDHRYSNSFRGLRVLLADDDDMHRAVTRRLLEKLGCNVSAVASGYECLSALGRAVSAIQIVLVDLHMPDMNGFEVTVKIRKFCSRNWPLIIALTAGDDEDSWEKCFQVGMNGVIRKPVLLQGIADELRRVLLHASRVP